jgi:Ca-activated chloride channel homolog
VRPTTKIPFEWGAELRDVSLWFGVGLVVACVTAVLVTAALAKQRRTRALARLGEPLRAARLIRNESPGKHALLSGPTVRACAAFLLLALALFRPRLLTGERLMPAKSLDVAVVLDFSKSMYARDISPSRITRAKLEVRDLLVRLQGARFAGVAYAGEAMTFPLSRDPSVITQFFRGLDPNDMPVGGTATAKALEQARLLFLRDPAAAKHSKAIVLITDGEDLEGDPVRVAENCAKDGIAIHVVQIGGRQPAPIPDMDDNGRVLGNRRDERGEPLTTAFSPAGEAQLERIATIGGGKLVKSAGGSTGIASITTLLEKQMKT